MPAWLYFLTNKTHEAQSARQCLSTRLSQLFIVELPKPTIGDISELQHIVQRVRRQNNPSTLGYKYNELHELDSIKVDLVPEKKGVILKHVEYNVASQVGYIAASQTGMGLCSSYLLGTIKLLQLDL